MESRPPVSARSWSERRDIDESNINLTAMHRLVHVGMRRVSGMSVFRAAFVVKVFFFLVRFRAERAALPGPSGLVRVKGAAVRA